MAPSTCPAEIFTFSLKLCKAIIQILLLEKTSHKHFYLFTALTSKSNNTGLRSVAIFEFFDSSSDGRVTVGRSEGQRFDSQVSQKFLNLFEWGIEPKGEQEEEQQLK